VIRFSQGIRFFKIYFIFFRYNFNRDLIHRRFKRLHFFTYFNPWSFRNHYGRAEALRITLETLGPIFIKFGQMLSTRPDLLPADIIMELSKLQDRVPPFSSEQVVRILERVYHLPLQKVFQQFDRNPLASASIAQVHSAVLFSGEKVVVKVLRPGLKKQLRKDLDLLYFIARLTQRWWSQGYRLRPVELVREYEEVIFNELDLMREAANASTLRRNFLHSPLMYVPKIHWEYTRKNVLVIERIYGVQISDFATLQKRGVNFKKLAESGVEIFFTQVFRDCFFHADMHPGNLFVDVEDPENPRYLGVDFGIMGTLGPEDQYYLAENLLAFFHRDYRRVAELHVKSGWVPARTRIDQLESAIRTVSEPIFERPLGEISFAALLIRLFQIAERFEMEIQPQLLLLQKTLLNIEGLGRQLYPALDLWKTAKPFLERYVRERQDLRSLVESFLNNLPKKLSKIPELVERMLGNLEPAAYPEPKEKETEVKEDIVV